MQDERRAFSRLALQLTGELVLSEQTVRGEVQDISMSGVFLHTSEPIEPGSEGALTLTFGEGDEQLVMYAHVRVARRTDGGLGLRVLELDLDSYHHLQRLVLYNADDYQAVRSEIDAHLGLRRRASGE